VYVPSREPEEDGVTAAEAADPEALDADGEAGEDVPASGDAEAARPGAAAVMPSPAPRSPAARAAATPPVARRLVTRATVRAEREG
jgi:hypothetical protein